MDHNQSPYPTAFTWSPIFSTSMPTPIDYSTSGLDIPHPLQPASSTSTYMARNGEHHDSAAAVDGDNVVMEDASETSRGLGQPIPLQSQPNAFNSTSRRSKHADLDWDEYQDTLHELYMQEGKTLTETMKIMKEQYGFVAPAKAYKEKFKFWKFQKNLPGEVAHWMVRKASLREERGKGTEFQYGGQNWTREQAFNRANRSKKVVEELVETPDGMLVVTPVGAYGADSPESPRDIASSSSSSVVFVSSEVLPTAATLPLNYNGQSRQDLANTLSIARGFASEGDETKAEDAYLDVFHGLEHLLSPIATDTVKIGYEIASFYWERGRRIDADAVLEGISKSHIDRLGMEHRSTQQHIQHVVELLNSWQRGEDALALLENAANTLKSEGPSRSGISPNKRDTEDENKSIGSKLQSLHVEVENARSQTTIDHGLASARLYLSSNESGIEVLLKAIERQCLRDPARLTVQGLQSRADLLKHYISKNKDNHITPWERMPFETAADLMKKFWGRTLWDREQFRSLEIIEASLELATGVLRGGLSKNARTMFLDIQKKANTIFGEDNERTIWTLISVGLVYQKYKSWLEAKYWFEAAYAAVDAAWGKDDGVYKSLERAFERRHFSYVSDEGRPFKTIFGVCGMTIRPTRLHLE